MYRRIELWNDAVGTHTIVKIKTALLPKVIKFIKDYKNKADSKINNLKSERDVEELKSQLMRKFPGIEFFDLYEDESIEF